MDERKLSETLELICDQVTTRPNANPNLFVAWERKNEVQLRVLVGTEVVSGTIHYVTTSALDSPDSVHELYRRVKGLALAHRLDGNRFLVDWVDSDRSPEIMRLLPRDGKALLVPE